MQDSSVPCLEYSGVAGIQDIQYLWYGCDTRRICVMADIK
jgi:hypothetical protein